MDRRWFTYGERRFGDDLSRGSLRRLRRNLDIARDVCKRYLCGRSNVRHSTCACLYRNIDSAREVCKNIVMWKVCAVEPRRLIQGGRQMPAVFTTTIGRAGAFTA
jgi:hypothetical protein